MLQVVTNVLGSTEIVSQVLYQDTLNTSGVADISTDKNISIYPQPSNNNFIISLTGNEKVDAVNIFDVSGKLVKRIECKNQTIINISTSDIPAGLYP